MFRLRDVPLRTKLNALLIGYTITVAAVMALAGYVLARYRVGGPIYQELNDHKNLTNEMTPPPLLIGRAYLMLSELENEKDPDVIRKMTADYNKYVKEYEDRRTFWLAHKIDPATKLALEQTSHDLALEVFRLAK